jgi:heptosyltransferase-2
MVMSQTLYKALKRLHPDTAIDVLAPAWCSPLLAAMPEVREALHMPIGHGELNLGGRRALGHSLRGRYQQAIMLPNSLKSALIPWFADIPLRTGWRGEMRYGLLNDIRKLDKERYPLMVERFVALAHEPGATFEIERPAMAVDEAEAAALLEALGIDAGKRLLALCPGAEFGPAKRWPEQHYAAVAEHFLGQGEQVVLLGSAKDRPVCEAIRSQLNDNPQCFNLAGETSLDQALHVLARASHVVSNDSGLMHIAAALNRPLAAVYGSTSPGFTPPLGDTVASLSIPVDCGPCFQRECPQGHMKCLKELSPALVIEALESFTK